MCQVVKVVKSATEAFSSKSVDSVLSSRLLKLYRIIDMAGKQSRMDRLSRLNMFSYPKRKARPPSPREEATFLHVIFVTWIHPLLKIGMKREITESDLYPTLFEDQSDHIGDHLEVLWGDHVDNCKENNQKPSLLKMITKTFHKKFLFFGLFSLAEETIFRIIQVIALGYVLDYFEGNYLTTLTGTVLFGVGKFFVIMISSYPEDMIHVT